MPGRFHECGLLLKKKGRPERPVEEKELWVDADGGGAVAGSKVVGTIWFRLHG